MKKIIIAFLLILFSPVILVILIDCFPLVIFGLIIYFIIKDSKNNQVKYSTVKKILSDVKLNVETNVAVNIEPLYKKSEKVILKTIIKEELEKNNYDKTKTIFYIDNRKTKLTIIFSILNFLFISFIFFHLPKWTYLLIFINIIIYIIFMKKYNIERYLTKQIKARPDDNISNIVTSLIQESYVSNKIKKISIILVSLVLPLIIYLKPMTFYEKTDDGYYVRFYTVGLTNYTKVDIPKTHKGKKVIGIRGNVFANMTKVEEINLPDSIEIIRGNAFKNDKKLTKIKLPSNLTYLGGSAFKNCTSLESIKIPEGVTEINGSTFENCTNLREVKLHNEIISIHGSSFRNCYSLEEIDLPDKITEIRGNTFENCTSLKKVEIPSSVTRIGGHAFYNNSSLSEVIISNNSQLNEIGSSAFRRCYSLYNINIPEFTIVNERAFKESPTIINRT